MHRCWLCSDKTLDCFSEYRKGEFVCEVDAFMRVRWCPKIKLFISIINYSLFVYCESSVINRKLLSLTPNAFYNHLVKLHPHKLAHFVTKSQHNRPCRPSLSFVIVIKNKQTKRVSHHWIPIAHFHRLVAWAELIPSLRNFVSEWNFIRHSAN